jgi:hypothetical protein
MADKTELGVIGFIFGVLSMVFSLNFPLGGIIVGIIGVIFSTKQKKINKTKFAKAGLILSIIGVILSIIAVLAFIYAFSQFPLEQVS